MTVSVYFAATAPLADPCIYRMAEEAASAQRKEKTVRFKREEDRRRSYAAELLLRKALLDRGLHCDPLIYAYGRNGKPLLCGTEGFHFNLSHSGNYAMCAAADVSVGCDLEKDADFGQSIARRFFNPEEYERILECPSKEERNDLFLWYWTLKESFLKCTGTGLSGSLNDCVIRPGANGEIRLVRNPCDREYRLEELTQAPDGYKAALCVAGSKARIRVQWIGLRELLGSGELSG